MRSIIVVKVFPSLQLRIEIHVIGVRQQLVKLGLIRSVGTLYLAVQLGRLGFDVHMPHALVFNMPVKASLKLMAPIRSDRADSEGKLFDDVIHELDRTSLVMFGMDL
jgi:hypothetical protein